MSTIPDTSQADDVGLEIRRQVDTDHRLITITLSGVMRDSDLSRLFGSVGGPDVESDFDLLVDLQYVNCRGISTQTISTMAMTPPVLASPARRAVVARTEVCFGLVRMYEMLRNTEYGGSVQVFRNLAEARHWMLGPAG